MKVAALALSLLVAVPVLGAETKTKKKRQPTGKVITNADVKKSKGKLIENKDAAELPPVEKTPGLVEQYEAARKTRLELEGKTSVLEATLALLESELAKLERAYFEENDPAVRDGAIARKFEEVRVQRDGVKKELEDLRKPAV